MTTTYFINYEALSYNMPECNDFEFLNHKFIANLVTQEIQNIIVPQNDILKANFTFQSCCLPYHDGHISYVTAINKEPLELSFNDENNEELHDKVIELVEKIINDMEEHLIFTTNIHIFFPIVKINVQSEDSLTNHIYGYTTNRPMPYRKWSHVTEGIDLMCRLHLHIDKVAFDEFRLHKSHQRYKRAFDYYIRSFHEYDHSSALCLLCSSLDAITGRSSSNDTKKRLAKYSSVLFCTPLQIEQHKKKMRHFYKIRSTFTHGKGNLITVQDEIELREYVRKFLLAYFLFWQEMNITHEPQMLQKLDEIYADHRLYTKYVPASYGFIRLSDEQEKQPNGIINMPMNEKHSLLVSKMMEAFVTPTHNTSLESTQTN